MPNPGLSIGELKKTGTFAKHSGRYRSRVLAVEGFVPLGDPPAHFNDLERDMWEEIKARATVGTLAESDFMLVELATRLMVKQRHDWENFSATQARVLQGIANDLGMSTIKRGKVSPAEKARASDALDNLQNILTMSDEKYESARRQAIIRKVGNAAMGNTDA